MASPLTAHLPQPEMSSTEGSQDCLSKPSQPWHFAATPRTRRQLLDTGSAHSDQKPWVAQHMWATLLQGPWPEPFFVHLNK